MPLETSWGLHIARSTVARADERLANRLAPTYQQLLLRLRASEVVHVDETGWKVAGQTAWLWVFTNDSLSVYTIDPTRAHEVVERILGEDFAGVLGCDCFLAYDALKTYTQSKCAGHLLRRCAEIMESKSGRAVCFSRQVARLLRAAITRSTATGMAKSVRTVMPWRVAAWKQRWIGCWPDITPTRRMPASLNSCANNARIS